MTTSRLKRTLLGLRPLLNWWRLASLLLLSLLAATVLLQAVQIDAWLLHASIAKLDSVAARSHTAQACMTQPLIEPTVLTETIDWETYRGGGDWSDTVTGTHLVPAFYLARCAVETGSLRLATLTDLNVRLQI